MNDAVIKAQLQIEAYVAEAQKELTNFKNTLDSTWKSSTPPKSILKDYEALRLKLSSLQKIANSKDGLVNITELKRASSDYKAIKDQIHNLQVEFSLMSDAQKRALLDPKVEKTLSEREKAIKKYTTAVEKNQEALSKKKPYEEELDARKKTVSTKKRSRTITTKQMESIVKPEANKAVETYIKNQEELLDVQTKIKNTQKAIDSMKSHGVATDTRKEFREASAYLATLQEKEKKLSAGKESYQAYSAAMEEYQQKIAPLQQKINALTEDIEEEEEEIKKLNKILGDIKTVDTEQALKDLKESLKALGVEGVDEINTIDGLKTKIDELAKSAIGEVKVQLDNAAAGLDKMGAAADSAKVQIDAATQVIKEQNDQVAKVKQFGERAKQFLGLAGAAQVLKNSIRSAFESIKELDAIMTEMAVVTDLKIGDYWQQLPEHVDRANELGIAIRDVYEAETLYYQQGLKTEEVVAMSTETLKMMRIAGLSAEDATNKMTAALRGFNMELNETSAKNVADVYSELAAITASDVDEISSAMTKTASIASNAGMEFETTAAFLAQIIETTRESAETAGTAMKTVIARFQELKKDPAEIGEVDGEIVDANKIEGALRSVGVALRDASGQFRDLDDVFLELAGKWSSLDTNTQRYIATIAAGSRQQSRFIAMMSDYERTQELVSAANNSAGASQQQYEKTLDSMASKLERLQNAWKEFTMGIMNSDFLKAGVDILTNLLNAINRVTEGFGSISGAMSKIGVVITAFRLAEILVKKLFATITAKATKFGQTIGNSIAEGVTEGMKKAEESVKQSAEDIKKTAEDKVDETKEEPPEKKETPKQQKAQEQEVKQEVEQEKEKQQKVEKEVDKEEEKKEAKKEESKKTPEKQPPQQTETLPAQRTPIEKASTEEQEATPVVIEEEHTAAPIAEEDSNEEVINKNTAAIENLTKATEENTEAEKTEEGSVEEQVVSEVVKEEQQLQQEQEQEQTTPLMQQPIGGTVVTDGGQEVPVVTPTEQTTTPTGVEEEATIETDNVVVNTQGTTTEETPGAGPQQNKEEPKSEPQATTPQTPQEEKKKMFSNVRDVHEASKTQSSLVQQGRQQALLGGKQGSDLEQAFGAKGPKMKYKNLTQGAQDSVKKQFTEKAKKSNKNLDDKAIEEAYNKQVKSGKKAQDVVKGLNQELEKFAEEGQEGPEGAAKSFDRLTVTEEMAGKGAEQIGAEYDAASQKASAGIKGMSESLGNVGMAATAAGVGFGMLGSMFDSMGLEGVGAAFSGIGTALTMVGGVTSAVSAIMSLFNGVQMANVAASVSQAVANGVQAGSWWAVMVGAIAAQTGMAPLLVITLLIVAAVLALVLIIAALVSVFNAIKNSTPEAKLKKAEAAAEAAGEAADAAAEAYQNLADSLDGLSDKYDALEELTKGTREWKDAVTEINQEIMDLVDEYPELAAFVERDSDGVLRLDVESDEVQGVLDTYQNKALSLSSAELASKISVLNAQTVVDRDSLSDQAAIGNETAIGWKKFGAGALTTLGVLGGGVGGAAAAYGGVKAFEGIAAEEARNDDYTDKMAMALADGLIVDGEVKDAGELKEKYGLSTEQAEAFINELGSGAEELREYGEVISARKQQEEALYDAMAANAAQMVDTSKMSEEAQDQITVAANSDYMQSFVENASGDFSQFSEEQVKRAAKDIYGENAEVDKDGNVTYTNESGTEVEVSASEFKKQYAAKQGTEDAAKALENLPKAIDEVADNLGKTAGRSFEKMYGAKDGQKLTQKDIANLTDENGNLDRVKLDEAWKNLSSEEKEAFGGYEQYINFAKESVEQAQNTFDAATATLEEMGIAGVKFGENISAAAAKGYGEKLETVGMASGQAGVDAVTKNVDAITKNMSEKEAEKFMSIINSMDWTDLDAWDQLDEQMEAAGLAAYTTGEEFTNFTSSAADAAGAIRKIDLDKLVEQMQGLMSISSKIKSGEQSRTFSSSDYETLIAADPELVNSFQQTLDGEYVYLGGTMEKLTAAIEANTSALLEEATDQLQSKIDAAEVMGGMATAHWVANKEKLDIDDWEDWEDWQVKSYMDYFLKETKANGVDLDKLGVDGLTNRTTLDNLTQEQIEQILPQLRTIYGEKEYNENLMNEKLISSQALEYQNDDITDNSLRSTDFREKIANRQELSEEERMQYKASTRAITAQAVSAGVNAVDITNYTKTLEAMDALEEKFKAGQISAAEFSRQYEILSKDAEDFEKTITNKTNLKKMNQNLQNTFSKIGELGEVFEKTTDKATKIDIVSDMVGDLGIKVDESNFEKIGELAMQMARGGEEGQKALEQLMQYAGNSFGVTNDEINLMLHSTYDNFNSLSPEMLAFTDSMVAQGLGMWKELEDGSKQFVLGTKENLDDAAEAAGTVREEWELSYSWMTNSSSQLDRLMREREKNEREFNDLLLDENASMSDIIDKKKEELNLLGETADYHAATIAQGYGEIERLFTDPEYAEYAKYVKYDAVTGTFTDDIAGLKGANFSDEKREGWEAWRAELEENNSIVLESKESLLDIQDEVEDIKAQGRDATSELYDNIKEGLVMERQEEIDALQNINDSIQKAQNALISKIQDQINEARQEKQNQEAEDALNDSISRLTYLQGDSSGNSALEALALEKEIEQSQEELLQTKVDQIINDMSQATAEAAEQRQHQIDIAQAQLELYVESQQIWADVQNILRDSLASAEAAESWSKAWEGTEAFRLSAKALNSGELNPLKQEDLKEELNSTGAMASIYGALVGDESGGGAGLANDIETKIKSIIGTTDEAGDLIGYLGNTLISSDDKSLVTTITKGNQAIVEAILGPEKGQVTDIMDSMAKANWVDTGSGYKAKLDILNWRTWEDDASGSSVRSYLDHLQKGANARGFDLSTLGISNLSNNVDLSSLNEKQLEEIIIRLESIYKTSKDLYGKETGLISNIDGYISRDQHNQNVAEKKKAEMNEKTKAATTTAVKNGAFATSGAPTKTAANKASFGVGDTITKLRLKDGELQLYDEDGIASKSIPMNTGNKNLPIEDVTTDKNGTPLYKVSSDSYKLGIFSGWLKQDQIIAIRPQKVITYATGGLADFTGPAWLDGTKSHPELVLNAQDTQNFIQLKDILSEVLHGTSSINNTNTNTSQNTNQIDIDINIEKISDDYDVEELADKIRSMLYDDASYRNTNNVSRR